MVPISFHISDVSLRLSTTSWRLNKNIVTQRQHYSVVTHNQRWVLFKHTWTKNGNQIGTTFTCKWFRKIWFPRQLQEDEQWCMCCTSLVHSYRALWHQNNSLVIQKVSEYFNMWNSPVRGLPQYYVLLLCICLFYLLHPTLIYKFQKVQTYISKVRINALKTICVHVMHSCLFCSYLIYITP